MTWHNFEGVRVPPSQPASLKRRYSVTADVLSFQRCSRQYGHFAVRGYTPAHSVQIYYGTLIHQVLDRAHAHYAGLRDPKTKDQIPTDRDIKYYFKEVDTALRARGIRSNIYVGNPETCRRFLSGVVWMTKKAQVGVPCRKSMDIGTRSIAGSVDGAMRVSLKHFMNIFTMRVNSRHSSWILQSCGPIKKGRTRGGRSRTQPRRIQRSDNWVGGS